MKLSRFNKNRSVSSEKHLDNNVSLMIATEKWSLHFGEMSIQYSILASRLWGVVIRDERIEVTAEQSFKNLSRKSSIFQKL